MTRPGMSDGRAFGLNQYLPSCQLNKMFENKIQSTSDNQYKEYLQTHFEKSKQFSLTPLEPSSLAK